MVNSRVGTWGGVCTSSSWPLRVAESLNTSELAISGCLVGRTITPRLTLDCFNLGAVVYRGGALGVSMFAEDGARVGMKLPVLFWATP